MKSHLKLANQIAMTSLYACEPSTFHVTVCAECANPLPHAVSSTVAMSGEKPSVSVNVAVANSAAQSLVSNVNSPPTKVQRYQLQMPSTCAATLNISSLSTSALQNQIQTSQPLVLPTSHTSAILALTKGQLQQVPSISLLVSQLSGSHKRSIAFKQPCGWSIIGSSHIHPIIY